MKNRRSIPAILAATVLFSAACSHNQPAIIATFDVEELPPEPPAPPPQVPEPAPPVAKSSPVTPPPDPAAVLRTINERLSPIYFETNRWEISTEAGKTIEENGRLLADAADWTATVEGHADERGSDSWNEVLGIWRAKAVKDALRTMGIDPSRMTILSHGKAQPAAPGRDEAALSRNRRVQIILHPGRDKHSS